MTPWRRAGLAVATSCVVLGTTGALASAVLGGPRVALLCWLGAGGVAAVTGLLGVLVSRPARPVPRRDATPAPHRPATARPRAAARPADERARVP